MIKIALFPGSFDPFTKGHESIVNQALEIFDEIIIGVGINTEKKYLFELDKRIQHIKEIYSKENRVKTLSYKGLTIDFCKKKDATHIIRGLRNSIDFEYEKSIAHMNNSMSKIQTIFLLTNEEHGSISSSIVREIYKNDGDMSLFVTQSNMLV
jgi:pantetheine-phosphate adenylyltransferase